MEMLCGEQYVSRPRGLAEANTSKIPFSNLYEIFNSICYEILSFSL